MINSNIKTKLGVVPSLAYPCANFITIKRGATSELTIDFNNYPYVVLDILDTEHYYINIEQFTYLFKMPSGEIINFKLFNEPSKPDTMDKEHFNIDVENNCLSFILKSTETAQLPLASIDEPIFVEAVFKMDTDQLLAQNMDSVIIEPQPPIVVVDSLYKESGLANLGRSR